MARTPNIDLREDYQRNYFINGNLDFWQRGTSFAAIASGAYNADRWRYSKSGTMVHTISRSTDVPTISESGFDSQYSMLVDCTTIDSSIGVSEYARVEQRIEGHEMASLYDKNFTISFWVKATKTGVYCVALQNSDATRSYVAEYTVNSANTWEKKSITVKHDSTGTWLKDNGIGMRVYFILAVGSDFHTTADSWQAGNFFGTSNQVNATDSAANDFRVSQIQITEGAEELPFRRAGRSIEHELTLCQRYYEKSYDADEDPGTAMPSWNSTWTFTDGTRVYDSPFQYLTEKRVNASITTYGLSGTVDQITFRRSGLTHTQATTSNFAIQRNDTKGFNAQAAITEAGFANAGGNSYMGAMGWTADSEL